MVLTGGDVGQSKAEWKVVLQRDKGSALGEG